jgi:hypothetical protein
MRKLKSILGYAWALTALPIILATFIGMNVWAKGFAGLTGLEISPWYSGGKSAYVVSHEGYTTTVNEPVFQGLVGETKKGFVQVKWTPAEGASLPDELSEAIDFDGDGAPDFSVRLCAGADKAELEATNQLVVGVREVLDLGKERAVRVNVLNPKRRQ